MASLVLYCDGYAEGSCTRRPHRLKIPTSKLRASYRARISAIQVPKCFQCGLRGVKALTLPAA